jgi:hypothetical protein
LSISDKVSLTFQNVGRRLTGNSISVDVSINMQNETAARSLFTLLTIQNINVYLRSAGLPSPPATIVASPYMELALDISTTSYSLQKSNFATTTFSMPSTTPKQELRPAQHIRDSCALNRSPDSGAYCFRLGQTASEVLPLNGSNAQRI